MLGIRRPEKKRDIRRPPNGEPVIAVFFRMNKQGTWEMMGPMRQILPEMQHLDSPPAQKGGEIVAGAIYWGTTKVFESKPLMVAANDCFTFNLADSR